jgi:hypothetical protein
MDNLFLNRMITPEADKPARGGQDSRQGIVKKKQETIFLISIGSQHCFRIILKYDFGLRLFFLTISKPPCPLVPYVAGGSDSIRL